MHITAYVISCADREPIRRQTLASLAATDWKYPARVEMDEATFARRQERQESTARRLLEHAVAEETELFLFLEDDLEFNRHLRHNLERWYPLSTHEPEDHFFASLYNPTVRELARYDERHYFVAQPDCVYGSQAFLLSLATARYIAAHWNEMVGMQDIKMSRLAARVSPIYYHTPSLVQHVGQTSTWGGPYHRAVDYQPDWKA
jgi:hypothetical protein